jgi:hypothetical protein
MGGGTVILQRKEAPAAERSRCWSWMHWRPVDAELHGEQVITRDRYDDLKTHKPQLQCIHCTKKMQWDPSTTRKEHLLLRCGSFAETEAYQDAIVVADREELLRKKAKASNDVSTCGDFGQKS